MKKSSWLKNVSLPRAWILALGVMVVVFILYLSFKFIFLGQSQESDLSKADNLTPRNVEGSMGGPGTPEYNGLIEELNRSSAQKAREKGESFVDTPIGQRIEVKKETELRKEREGSQITLAPQPMAKEPVSSKRTQSQSAQNSNLVEAMVGDLKGLSPNEPGAFVVSHNTLKDPSGGQSLTRHEDQGNGLANPQKPKIEPGTILYAVTELAVNSDVPAPVMARVIEGKYSGLKFFGGFGLHGEKLTLSFSQMLDPQSGSYGVEALAVDPKTDSPALSGHVDSHFLSRWGGLVASSFLEGFGNALSDRGTTVSVYGDVVAVDKDQVSLGQISLEALGQVGSRAATQLEKNFDRAPTVTIPAGSPIGLLILNLKD
ncbi:MAG: hypothetical protein LBE80_04340 [Deltaproteobacteria bacterium]|jgi:type IV secretory pathway VirB10-like protein|nr:hypothetical protein [Deltaproteobacteria bacterium]